MAWSVWLVPPIITSVFFVLGVITLYWSIFNWVTARVQAHHEPNTVKKIQVAIGTACAVVSIFALQVIVRGSHLAWTFTNFQLLLLIFVAYFLQLRIPYWVILISGVGFMVLNGNVSAPLSWVYTIVFVLFYVVSYRQSLKLNRWPFARYMAIALVFALVLWFLVKQRYSLSWGNYVTEIADYALLAALMYGYFIIQNKDRRIKDRLFQSANWDALTHVQNYAAFDRAIGYQFQQSLEHDHDLSMIMFDIDHFKRVNDGYGHLAGDEVLKQVASQVTDVLQSLDPSLILYRTGGEEFNIILPGYDLEQTRPIAGQVFHGVQHLVVTYNEIDIQVSISVGVSRLVETDHNPLDFYKRVDANLYHSKQNGRQQITVA
ncbi:diguanylate cyclase [Levilactobacillus tangyuanensis]|uniref:Diguanylate cyclase n=1 Tax=Levilactobacillus tangyuanensis TaxID=2486021 RepID=A0ABW1TNT8_9LACO|nr:diguanylate cyclase [Levilactobacillus tangyuanensis]